MEKEELLKEGNISLVLNSYQDIFSSFDPRNYREKAVSDDFLMECKRAARDKKDKFELRLFVPRIKRNYHEEVMIKKRLKEHFHKHYKILEKEIKSTKFKGILWFIIGAILMAIGTFILSLEQRFFIYNFLILLLEPASWFFFWEGLNQVFFIPKEYTSEQNFYKKMSVSEIVFMDY
jgi:hypothetical protein